MKKVLVCSEFSDVTNIREALLIQKGDMTSTIKFDNQEVACVYNHEIFPLYI